MKTFLLQTLYLLLILVFQASCSQDQTWDSLTEKGKKAYYADRLAEAEELYLLALKKSETLEDSDWQLSHTFFDLGMLYQYEGKFSKAEFYYQKSLALKEKLDPNSRGVATTLNNLALLYIRQGKSTKGQELLTQGLNIWEKLEDLENPVVATSFTLQAIVYRDEERFTEAEKLFRRTIELSKQVRGIDKGLALDHWGLLHERQGNLNEAEDLYKQAIQFHETSYGPVNAELAKSLTFLGSLYVKQGRFEEAKLPLQRAIAIQEKIFKGVHPDLMVTLEINTELLRLEHKEAEATESEARIQFIKSKINEWDDS